MPSINEKIVLNFRDVRRRLKDLPAKVRNRVVRRAMYAGAKVLRDRARELVPVDTGALRAAITAASDRDRRTQEFFGRVYVSKRRSKRGRRARRAPRRYAHLVEFGTVKSSAKPFLTRAFVEAQDEVISAIAAEMRAGIDREAAS